MTKLFTVDNEWAEVTEVVENSEAFLQNTGLEEIKLFVGTSTPANAGNVPMVILERREYIFVKIGIGEKLYARITSVQQKTCKMIIA